MLKCPECKKEYDNEISLNHHWVRGHKLQSKDLYKFLNENYIVCACGCGEEPNYKSITKGFKLYVHGHNKKPPIVYDNGIEKYCPKCKKVLLLSNFGIRNDKQKYQSYCNGCCLRYRNERSSIINKKSSEWYYKNKKRVFARMAYRFKNDISYRITLNMRRYVGDRIRNNIIPAKKYYKTMKLLDCSVETLKEHLENKFIDGMSWKNYGQKGWHIDHIVPCSSFDLRDVEQQKKCFHYTNLQPLWWYDNIKKGNKII